MSSYPEILDAERHYRDRMRHFAAEETRPGGIVLVGSSHFEWFDTDRFLPGYRFVNRAIASDRLGIGDRGILHRLGISVFDVQPALILFNNAVNDLGELSRTGEPPFDVICNAYDRVISAIREGAPDVPLLIVNELPTTGRFTGINELIPEFNTHVKRVAAKHGCGHLDFHSEVVNSTGALREDLTYDGLHMNDAGYTLFATHLRPHLPNVAG